VKSYALQKYLPRMDHLERRLQGREFLLERLSVADAYLFVVLNWAAVTPVALAEYPAVRAYHERLRKRPSIARAVAEELVLFRNEQARHAS
jgi:glutathione S-transferase